MPSELLFIIGICWMVYLQLLCNQSAWRGVVLGPSRWAYPMQVQSEDLGMSTLENWVSTLNRKVCPRSDSIMRDIEWGGDGYMDISLHQLHLYSRGRHQCGSVTKERLRERESPVQRRTLALLWLNPLMARWGAGQRIKGTMYYRMQIGILFGLLCFNIKNLT